MPNKRVVNTDPAHLVKGIIVTDDERLADVIGEEIRFICKIALKTPSPALALEKISTETIQVLYLHLDDGDTISLFALVEQVRRLQPDIRVFLVAAEKNSDHILQGLRLGIEDYIIVSEKEESAFLAPLQKAMGQEQPGSINGYIYSLFSMKGGQGVTSLCVNLADQIREVTGGRVLLLDLNLYLGGVNSALNCTHNCTAYDLIRDHERMDENLLFSSLFQHPHGFYVVPGPAEVSDAERIDRSQVIAMLTLLRRYFTYIVVDLPHDFTERTLATIEESDKLLIVVEPDLLSVKSVQQTLYFFQELNYTDTKIGVLLNRQDNKNVLQKEDIEIALQQPLFAAISNGWKTLSQAQKKGEPLSGTYRRQRVTQDIRAVAAKLTGISDTKGSLGLLQRWFTRYKRYETE